MSMKVECLEEKMMSSGMGEVGVRGKKGEEVGMWRVKEMSELVKGE